MSKEISLKSKIQGAGLFFVCLLSILISLTMLVTLLTITFFDGLPYLDFQFLISYPSRFPEKAGILAAFVGSIWIALLTSAIAFPLGVAAAVYLEEYAPDNLLTSFIKVNILNLSGIPSIIYGILGLGLFVEILALGRSILAASLTLALLILPIIIISSQEAIRDVPKSHKEGAYALGATKWQVTSRVTLREAYPRILTGLILGTSRVIGETAPLIAISALVYIRYLPTTIFDSFTVVPIQILNWVNMPQKEFQALAAAGIVILLVILLGMNSIAIYIRNKNPIISE